MARFGPEGWDDNVSKSLKSLTPKEAEELIKKDKKEEPSTFQPKETIPGPDKNKSSSSFDPKTFSYIINQDSKPEDNNTQIKTTPKTTNKTLNTTNTTPEKSNIIIEKAPEEHSPSGADIKTLREQRKFKEKNKNKGYYFKTFAIDSEGEKVGVFTNNPEIERNEIINKYIEQEENKIINKVKKSIEEALGKKQAQEIIELAGNDPILAIDLANKRIDVLNLRNKGLDTGTSSITIKERDEKEIQPYYTEDITIPVQEITDPSEIVTPNLFTEETPSIGEIRKSEKIRKQELKKKTHPVFGIETDKSLKRRKTAQENYNILIENIEQLKNMPMKTQEDYELLEEWTELKKEMEKEIGNTTGHSWFGGAREEQLKKYKKDLQKIREDYKTNKITEKEAEKRVKILKALAGTNIIGLRTLEAGEAITSMVGRIGEKYIKNPVGEVFYVLQDTSNIPVYIWNAATGMDVPEVKWQEGLMHLGADAVNYLSNGEMSIKVPEREDLALFGKEHKLSKKEAEEYNQRYGTNFKEGHKWKIGGEESIFTKHTPASAYINPEEGMGETIGEVWKDAPDIIKKINPARVGFAGVETVGTALTLANTPGIKQLVALDDPILNAAKSSVGGLISSAGDLKVDGVKLKNILTSKTRSSKIEPMATRIDPLSGKEIPLTRAEIESLPFKVNDYIYKKDIGNVRINPRTGKQEFLGDYRGRQTVDGSEYYDSKMAKSTEKNIRLLKDELSKMENKKDNILIFQKKLEKMYGSERTPYEIKKSKGERILESDIPTSEEAFIRSMKSNADKISSMLNERVSEINEEIRIKQENLKRLEQAKKIGKGQKKIKGGLEIEYTPEEVDVINSGIRQLRRYYEEVLKLERRGILSQELRDNFKDLKKSLAKRISEREGISIKDANRVIQEKVELIEGSDMFNTYITRKEAIRNKIIEDAIREKVRSIEAKRIGGEIELRSFLRMFNLERLNKWENVFKSEGGVIKKVFEEVKEEMRKGSNKEIKKHLDKVEKDNKVDEARGSDEVLKDVEKQSNINKQKEIWTKQRRKALERTEGLDGRRIEKIDGQYTPIIYPEEAGTSIRKINNIEEGIRNLIESPNVKVNEVKLNSLLKQFNLNKLYNVFKQGQDLGSLSKTLKKLKLEKRISLVQENEIDEIIKDIERINRIEKIGEIGRIDEAERIKIEEIDPIPPQDDPPPPEDDYHKIISINDDSKEERVKRKRGGKEEEEEEYVKGYKPIILMDERKGPAVTTEDYFKTIAEALIEGMTITDLTDAEAVGGKPITGRTRRDRIKKGRRMNNAHKFTIRNNKLVEKRRYRKDHERRSNFNWQEYIKI